MAGLGRRRENLVLADRQERGMDTRIRGVARLAAGAVPQGAMPVLTLFTHFNLAIYKEFSLWCLSMEHTPDTLYNTGTITIG